MLPSGVRVVVLRDRSAPVVAARAVWIGGGSGETGDAIGMTRLLAAAWTGGCGGLDPEALARELAADGASMAGFAGREVVGLRAEWTRAGWERGLDLLADCVTSPRFSSSAIERARRREAELEGESSSPAWAALDLLDQALRPGAAPATSSLAEHADSAQLLEHLRAHCPTPAMTLAIVGDVDPDRVLARARARFGSAPRAGPPDRPASASASVSASASTSVPALAPAGPGPDLELYRHLAGGRDVAAVAVGFAAVARAHRDRAALEVAAELMGGAPGALLLADAHAGYIALHRTCRTGDVSAALASLHRAAERLRDPGASEEEVRRAAGRLAQARRDALARAPQAAGLLALYEALGPGADGAARHADALAAVRAADVRAAAKRYLRPDAEVIATAMPLLASPGAARRMRGVARPPPRHPERPERRRRR
ncbi:MAG TPA: insulinase family protein [Candidatus Acidoferrum sp.]|nr:insulinase family protein [Candidatus Acidoferrum sp.]